jgi:hypothetical protein
MGAQIVDNAVWFRRSVAAIAIMVGENSHPEADGTGNPQDSGTISRDLGSRFRRAGESVLLAKSICQSSRTHLELLDEVPQVPVRSSLKEKTE